MLTNIKEKRKKNSQQKKYTFRPNGVGRDQKGAYGVC